MKFFIVLFLISCGSKTVEEVKNENNITEKGGYALFNTSLLLSTAPGYINQIDISTITPTGVVPEKGDRLIDTALTQATVVEVDESVIIATTIVLESVTIPNLVTDGTLSGRGTSTSPLTIDIDATDINVDDTANPKVLLSEKIANLGNDIGAVSGNISTLNSKIDSNISIISNDVSVLRDEVNAIDNSGVAPSLVTDGTLTGSGTSVSPLKIDIDATDINVDDTANPKVLLSERIANLGSDIGIVSSDILNLKGDIDSNINIVSGDVSTLKGKMNTITDDVADIDSTLAGLNSKIGNLDDLQNGESLVDAINLANDGSSGGGGTPTVGSYKLYSYPTATLMTSMVGFADSVKLVVEDSVPGQLYRLYSDSSCKDPISNWQEALSTETSFVVSVNEVKTYYFYISREESGLPTCYNTGKGYNKVAVDLVLSGIDNIINYSFTKYDQVSYYLKLGTGAETEVSSNSGQLSASVGVHQVRIRAVDSTGKETQKSSYVNVQGSVTMATTLYTAMDTLLYSPGFSSNIKIQVTGYAIGDIVGIYSDSSCNTAIIEQPMSSLNYKFTVPAEIGSNTYYVRKLTLPSLTPSPCIATNTYIRSDIEALSETLELGIKLTFGMTTIVPNSAIRIKLNDNDFMEVVSPYIFESLTAGTSYSITVVATDENGITRTITHDNLVPNTFESIDVRLVRTDGNPFLSNPGLSTQGKLELSGIVAGSKVGIFKSSDCNTSPEMAITTVNTTTYSKPVTFINGTNRYFIYYEKSGETGKCTPIPLAYEYKLTHFENSLTSTTYQDWYYGIWEPLPFLANYVATIDGGTTWKTPKSSSPYEILFEDLPRGNYVLQVKATDQDGAIKTIQVPSKLVTNYYVKMWNRGSGIIALRNDKTVFVSNVSSEVTIPNNYGINDVVVQAGERLSISSDFLLIRENGTITKGNTTTACSLSLQEKIDIIGYNSNYLFLNKDGMLESCGIIANMPDLSDNSFKKIYTSGAGSGNAFAGLRQNGSVKFFGNFNIDTSSAGIQNYRFTENITGLATVMKSQGLSQNANFIAILNDDDDLVNGGDLYCTGSYCPPGNNYIKVSSCGYNNFITLDTNGTATLWDASSDVSATHASILVPNYNFVDIYNSSFGCTLVRSDKSIIYVATNGGTSVNVIGSNFKEIISGYSGYVGISGDNLQTYWGAPIVFNGIPAAFPVYEQIIMTGAISAQYQSYISLNILRNDGYINTYASTSYGGNILGPDQDIAALTPYIKPNL